MGTNILKEPYLFYSCEAFATRHFHRLLVAVPIKVGWVFRILSS